MTDFLDDVLADVARTGPECTVRLLLERLGTTDPDLADGIQKALDHPSAPNSAISRKLRERGHTISDTTIGRHRRGDCRCKAVA